MAAPAAGGGMMSGLGGMVMQGMAMGTGSAIAHRAVDSMMGPKGESAPAEAAPAAAAPQSGSMGTCPRPTPPNDSLSLRSCCHPTELEAQST